MKSNIPSYSHWLQNAINYLLDNIFDILTVLATVYVITRHQLHPYGPNDIADLATWILAILGLIAVSGLWQQHRHLKVIENLSKETRDLVVGRFGDQVDADDFFWHSNKKIAVEDYSQAKEIYILGMILDRTLRDHMATLSERLAAGSNIRVIILDRKNENLMAIMPFRSYGTRSKEGWQDRIRQAEEHVRDLADDRCTGSLRLGYLPFFPSFGMWLIDPDRPSGQIHVEIYHHRTAEMNPSFTLCAYHGSSWYYFFRKQFDLAWQSCELSGKVIDISPAGKSETPK